MAWHNLARTVYSTLISGRKQEHFAHPDSSGLRKFLSKIGNGNGEMCKKISQSVSAFKLQTMTLFLLLKCQKTATFYATSVRLYKGSDM